MTTSKTCIFGLLCQHVSALLQGAVGGAENLSKLASMGRGEGLSRLASVGHSLQPGKAISASGQVHMLCWGPHCIKFLSCPIRTKYCWHHNVCLYN